ncbi:hypothetical protein AAIP58_000093 [Flavobacterium psychrophilum]|nr:hypothetical protein [Flavobacterium psychrophilum]
MAILFTKSLQEDKLLFAYNNNVIRFKSDSTLVVKNCMITIAGIEPIVLYPSPRGNFYYNFKELVLSLMNFDKFKDDLQYTVIFDDWTNKIFINANILIRINFTDSSSESVSMVRGFVSGLQNEYEYISNRNPFFLTPQKKVNDGKVSLKTWKGYPFDFAYFNGNNGIAYISNYVRNTSQTAFQITRCVTSDGASNNLSLNYNTRFEDLQLGFDTPDFSMQSILTLEKITPSCYDGHYIKWINTFGGWNYWLFKKGKENLNTKGIGEINNDFDDLEDTLSKTENVGVTSQGMIYVQDDFNSDDMLIITDLLESPKIYFFTGRPNTPNTFMNWKEVTIKEKSNKIKDAKSKFVNIYFEIELPKRTTRTL